MHHANSAQWTRRPPCLMLLWLSFISMAGCIVIEVPSDSRDSQEPAAPEAVRAMQGLGYAFSYRPDPGPYWEAENAVDGWVFRVYEDGSFGMSGQFDKDFDA